ncbi:MAG: hypothetical protein PVI92_12735, partial [Chromatiales bacterium]
DYIDAQHILEVTETVSGLAIEFAFELAITLLTLGAGATVAVATKVRHAEKLKGVSKAFRQLAQLLKKRAGSKQGKGRTGEWHYQTLNKPEHRGIEPGKIDSDTASHGLVDGVNMRVDGRAPNRNVYPKTLSAQKKQAVIDRLDVTFARSDEIIRNAIETGRIPDVAQNRIVLREGAAGLPKRYNGNGLNYAFNNHSNSAMAHKKSQFTISNQEVISLLQDKNVIASPVTIANASSNKVGGLSLVRQVDLSELGYGAIGKLPQNPAFNGASTSKITIITDGFGNLKNVFPGYLDDL